MAIRTCDSIITAGECAGHLGKFDSCQDEALYELSMDADETTGTSEFQGHLARVMVSADESVALDNGPTVTVPAGHYVIETANSGAVSVYDFDQAAWNRASAAYEAWDAPEWCDDCTFDQRCQIHADMLAANS